ncbi:MAG: NAD-dependent epimerase/dehydratase family protein [Bacteroidales bacterium]
MKVILFGSTGMIGQGVLLACLENKKVESILVINRRSHNKNHPKLKEIILTDLFDLSGITTELEMYDCCFFCLGVSSNGLSYEAYKRITYDLTIYVAETLLKINPKMTFSYISGAGTDSSEKGRMMWARVKGKTENTLLSMPFMKAYMFRPGFIQPKNGIRSSTKIYNIMYAFFKPFYFALKHFRSFVTDTETLGKAMIAVAFMQSDKNILESVDINKLGRNV